MRNLLIGSVSVILAICLLGCGGPGPAPTSGPGSIIKSDYVSPKMSRLGAKGPGKVGGGD
jgi:hypothetical protein